MYSLVAGRGDGGALRGWAGAIQRECLAERWWVYNPSALFIWWICKGR